VKPNNWKDFTKELVLSYCNDEGKPTFTLQELQKAKKEEIINFKKTNNNPFDKIRQQLQFLRNDGIVQFVDNKGTYALRKLYKGKFPHEQEEELNQKEYNKEAKEVFNRDRSLVKQAKQKFGNYCLHPNCSNTFKKDDKLPYIEVHHIIPLFEGGEDAIWNLAVVCAHHHKMAHFAENNTQKELQKLLIDIVKRSISS
jgi:predicted HNH restriction endonuclease